MISNRMSDYAAAFERLSLQSLTSKMHHEPKTSAKFLAACLQCHATASLLPETVVSLYLQ